MRRLILKELGRHHGRVTQLHGSWEPSVSETLAHVCVPYAFYFGTGTRLLNVLPYCTGTQGKGSDLS